MDGGLGKKAIACYNRGHNCSQCVMKAADGCYKLKLSKNALDMCEGINNGFGVGSVCSVLLAGIMLFGIMLDANETKRARMLLLTECCEKYGSLDCAVIKKWRKKGNTCEDIIEEIANMVERIIEQAGA